MVLQENVNECSRRIAREKARTVSDAVRNTIRQSRTERKHNRFRSVALDKRNISGCTVSNPSRVRSKPVEQRHSGDGVER